VNADGRKSAVGQLFVYCLTVFPMSKSIAPAFDIDTAKSWIFPKSPNFAIRDYQVNICKEALFTNTLVCLPTGLGKTLIAAVVMYNFYRWFPTGKKR
jgi:hypothetical protein